MKNFENFAYVIIHNVVDITTTCNLKAGHEFSLAYGKDDGGVFGHR